MFEQASWILFLKYLDDLKDFVDHRLFPYLKKFKADAVSAEILEKSRGLL